MLEKFKYVFIIGAGGSNPYGFPLGLELYNNIKNNFPRYIAQKIINFMGKNGGDATMPVYGTLDNYHAEAEQFTEQLKLTSNIQIDKYLNIHPRFKDIGLSAIVTEMYNSEIKSLSIINDVENNWYSYLYSKMTEGLNTPEDLKNIHVNKISFITFNYDRSLEHYLFENLYGLLKNRGINRKTLAESFKNIPVIHVFGKIGYLPWEQGFYDDQNIKNEKKHIVGYGIKDFDVIPIGIEFRNMIEIMYSNRENNPEIKHAHKLISEADRILFLGFGYDDENLKILNIPELLEDKQVFGTAYNATKNEIIHIKKKLNFSRKKTGSEIYAFDCLMLLREHLI